MPELTWIPWPIPEHRRQGGGGGWCVTLGEPNERVSVGRQVGGVPTLSRDEAEFVAAALNRAEVTVEGTWKDRAILAKQAVEQLCAFLRDAGDEWARISRLPAEEREKALSPRELAAMSDRFADRVLRIQGVVERQEAPFHG